MPQMAPINWTLFFMLSTTIILISFSFFNFIKINNQNSNTMNKPLKITNKSKMKSW